MDFECMRGSSSIQSDLVSRTNNHGAQLRGIGKGVELESVG